MAPEVQQHGFTFEKWVHEAFFESYKTRSYTDEWDVHKGFNVNYGGVSVSIKTAKYGSPVGLGDALRQFHISEDFLFIIGFWRQEKGKKRIVNIVAAPTTVALWRLLWHPITEDDLRDLDSVIKDRSLTYQQARIEAKHIKSQQPFPEAHITVNPKIDSKTQRRLQFSLGFSTLFSTVAPDSDQKPVDIPKLFGIESIEAFLSNPRVFNKSC